MKTITSRHNPVVARFRRAAAGRDDRGSVLLDGWHLIEAAVRANLPIQVLAASADAVHLDTNRRLLDLIDQRGGETYAVPDDLLAAISPVRTPSGAVALADRPAAALPKVLERVPQLIVVGIDVQDPGNVGAIVRAAEAAGATGAVLAGASADPFGWKALRGSMGSAFRLPVVTAPWSDVFGALRDARISIVATVPRGGTPLFGADLAQALALLVGGEGPGLPDDVVSAADLRVSIPMHGAVESLNVAVATAILVYEASRQRGSL